MPPEASLRIYALPPQKRLDLADFGARMPRFPETQARSRSEKRLLLRPRMHGTGRRCRHRNRPQSTNRYASGDFGTVALASTAPPGARHEPLFGARCSEHDSGPRNASCLRVMRAAPSGESEADGWPSGLVPGPCAAPLATPSRLRSAIATGGSSRLYRVAIIVLGTVAGRRCQADEG